MLHELKNGVYEAAYAPYEIGDRDTLLLISGEDIFVHSIEPLVFPTYEELKNALSFPEEGSFPKFLYLFTIEGKRYFTAMDAAYAEPLPGCYRTLHHQLRKKEPQAESFAGLLGAQLIGWYDRNRYCGRCGHPAVHDGRERMMRCPKCHNMIFPQICPSIVVGVFHEGKLLVTHYNPHHMMVNNGSMYSPAVHGTLVAGYIETGETAEQAVRREVFEETGLRVKNIRYYMSAPWPLSSSLLFGYLCEVDGDASVRVDPDELSDAVFLSPSELRDRSKEMSLTSRIMEDFRTGKIEGYGAADALS